MENGLGSKVAYYWEGEPGDARTLTYADLQREVNKCANALVEMGVKTGDRVGIYMPMIPELPIAMLACAKLGAPHVVVFGGFSSDALEGRMIDSEAVVLVTSDGAWRNGKVLDLKSAADVAVDHATTIKNVLVVKRTGNDVAMEDGRDHWWHDMVERQSDQFDPVPVDSEHLLYLLHTSGTTAKPKGIMHTTGGYLTGVSTTHHYIFDIKPDDVYWCAADIGWVTGHSYIVYGPLANATTSVMYEGAPMFPEPDRWWSIIEKYKVSILYCAPTAIRAFMKQGESWPGKHDLSSLRILGTVGRADQPRGLALVPRDHRGRQVPGRRHLVADRDRDDPDHPATWRHHAPARLRHRPVPRPVGQGGRRRRQGGGQWRGRRVPRPHPAVAGDAARDLQGSRAVHEHLLEALPGDVLRRRWLQGGRRGLLLAPRAASTT